MLKLLLPTSDIFLSHKHFEPLLYFYEDGVRGLVRDTVLLSSQPLPGSEDVQALRERLVAEYDRCANARFLENSMRRHEYASFLVEMAAEEIDYRVAEMMWQFLRGRVYEVCKTRWKWVGADLVATIQILS